MSHNRLEGHYVIVVPKKAQKKFQRLLTSSLYDKIDVDKSKDAGATIVYTISGEPKRVNMLLTELGNYYYNA